MQKGGTASKALHKRKAISEFLIRKAFYKDTVCSKYRVMTGIIIRNVYRQTSVFDIVKILEGVDYLSLISLVALVDIH